MKVVGLTIFYSLLIIFKYYEKDESNRIKREKKWKQWYIKTNSKSYIPLIYC